MNSSPHHRDPTRAIALAFALVFALLSPAGAGGDSPLVGTKIKETGMNAAERGGNGSRDFDFLIGGWKVHNRRLRARLQGSTEWEEFEATNVVHALPAGIGNEDEYRTDFAGGFVGMAFRFFNKATEKWAIYWADSRYGTVDPPVIGSFAGDIGTFEGTDTFEGRPICVRFIWSRVRTASPRWEQAFSADEGRTWETNWVMDLTRLDRSDRSGSGSASKTTSTAHVDHLKDFSVIEFRRYAIKPGARDEFARYFETFFPEAFEQIGAIAFGQFRERRNADAFTWIRGFRSPEARGIANSAFYYGPPWKEHAATMNDRLVDSDNVLLLRPWAPDRGIPVLPAVDPVTEAGSTDGVRGVVVAQIFSVREGSIDAFAKSMEPTFAAYRAAGMREAGVLVTLDGRNTFPQHPVRTDGPYLVWLGIAENDGALESGFQPLAERSLPSNSAGLLRDKPELVILDPTSRSRLRWR
jgi:hypothetical protein